MDCTNQICDTCQPDCCSCSPCCHLCSACTCYSCGNSCDCNCCCRNLDTELSKSPRIKDDTPKTINMRFSNSISGPRFKNSPQPVSLGKKGKSKIKDSARGKSKGPKGNKKVANPGKSAIRSSLKSAATKKTGKEKEGIKASKKKSRGRSEAKKGTKGSSKSKSSKSSSSKSKSTSKSKAKKSKSTSSKAKKSSKKGKSSKGTSKDGQKKKNRGRSKRKSGRKPRGPPPTPVTIDARKAQTQAIERLEKFNRFRLKERPQEISLVHELRGYCSEPEMTIPCDRKFEFKAKRLKQPTKVSSMEDVSLCLKSAEELLKECPYDDEDFKEINISPATWKKWFDLFEMEKQRFSFFDELYARKYVTDSMELPLFNEDISYLIEADDVHYRTKIDYGRIVLKTKHIYTGNFVDWYFQGPGRYVWLDGGVYQGDFVNGVMHGQGTFLWPDGSIYDGQYHEGVRKGWGVYTTSKGYIFTGEWVDGVPSGNGKIWYDPINNPGNYYEGHLRQGVPNGIGTRQYANGDVYIGTWADGVRNGRGTMLWREQKQMYRGEWAAGVPHGEGIQVWYVPQEKNNKKKCTRYIFKGLHEAGVRQGKGTIFFQDSSVYEGFWSKGRQLNDGVYTDPVGEFLLSIQCIQPDEAGYMEEIFDRPTYECIFEKLVKSLSDRIPITSIDPSVTEERQLTNICFKYMPELRLLYQRTIDLGALWTNNTLGNKLTGPTNSAKNCFSGKQECSKIQYGGLHNIFTMLNELAEHEVKTASKFGLWLFIKDCENTLRHATMGHYNKHWHSCLSICFQDEYSPFEVVHFWQFLQCLIVAAFEMYAGIPFHKSRIKYKFAVKSGGNAGKEEKVINSTCVGKKGLESLSDDDLMDLPAAGDGTVGRAPSALIESDEQTETDEIDLVRKDSSDSDAFSPEGIERCPISISDIFEMFIKENLFNCFEHQAGKLLPPLVNPLPPLNDLYQAFRSIKNEGKITAIDFLYSVIPHKIHPDNMDSSIYWTRTKQILSTDVHLEDIFDHTKQLQTYGNMREPESKEVFQEQKGSGDVVQSVVSSETKESIPKVSKSFYSKVSLPLTEVPKPLQKCMLPEPDTKPASISTVDSVQSDKPQPARKPRIIAENIHSIVSELLVPDENVSVDTEAYEKGFKITNTGELRNLDSEDVITVLRDLYPELCGPPSETCLTFDMIFCDWLWAVMLCSNASTAKDESTCRKTLCKTFRMPLAISKIQDETLQLGICGTCCRRGNNRKFYFEEIIPVFLKHQEIRGGEKWMAENTKSISRPQQTTQVSSMSTSMQPVAEE